MVQIWNNLVNTHERVMWKIACKTWQQPSLSIQNILPCFMLEGTFIKQQKDHAFTLVTFVFLK